MTVVNTTIGHRNIGGNLLAGYGIMVEINPSNVNPLLVVSTDTSIACYVKTVGVRKEDTSLVSEGIILMLCKK